MPVLFSKKKKKLKRRKVIRKKAVKPYLSKEIVSKRKAEKREYHRAAQLFYQQNLPRPAIVAKKAVDSFRPTQKQLGRFIFIDGKGKEIKRAQRRNYSQLKGYMVFVSKTGHKKLIKQHVNQAGQPIAGFIYDHNIFSAKVKVSQAAKERARKYFLSRYLFEIEPSTTEMKTQYHTYTDIKVQGGKGAVINFYEFAEELSAKIAKVANRVRKSEHTRTVVLAVELHIKFYNKANKLEKIVPVNMPVIWCRGKGLIRKDFAFPIITSVGYSNMVEILNRMGIVLAASSKHVQKLLRLKRASQDKHGVVTYKKRYKRGDKYIEKVIKWKKQNYKPVELYSLGAIIKMFRTQ